MTETATSPHLRKIRGRTPGEARSRAVELYGNRFVVVETSEQNGSEPASITVYVQSDRLEEHQAKDAGTVAGERADHSDRTFQDRSKRVVQPLWEQVGKLFESGSSTLSSLKNVSPPYSGGGAPAVNKKVVEKQGVSWVRSSDTPTEKTRKAEAAVQTNRITETLAEDGLQNKPVPAAPTPAASPIGTKAPETAPGKAVPEKEFRNYLRRQPAERAASPVDKAIPELTQRIEQLEKMVQSLSEPEPVKDPFWRFLRNKQFPPSLLERWFKHAEASRDGNTDGAGPLIQQQVQSQIEEWFDRTDPLSGSNKHLFTSFAGVNIAQFVLSLAGFCNRSGLDYEVGIVYTNEYESDILGFQLMDSLHTLQKECHDIVTNKDWQELTDRTDNRTLLFLLTLPMPFDYRGAASALDHLNGIFGEYHFVRHHFVSHALHDPDEILSRLPLDHVLKPDYITLTHLDMAGSGPGKLALYKERTGCDYGFFHTSGLAASESALEPFGNVDGSLSRLLCEEYESFLSGERAARARSQAGHLYRNLLSKTVNLHPNHN